MFDSGGKGGGIGWQVLIVNAGKRGGGIGLLLIGSGCADVG